MNQKSVFSNFIWRFMERCGAQGLKLIVELVLARLLLPNDYGIIALVTVFISMLNVFVDSGFANALIQKKKTDDLDFSTVFWFNLVWCLFIYIILFFGLAPIISKFYGERIILNILRILGIQIIISGIKNVQLVYVSRNMQFKKFFYSTIGGTLISAIVGIIMAYCGFGVWALVAQQLVNSFFDTLILWITVKWRPKKLFSFSRLKELFQFGWKLLVSALLETTYNEIRQLIIGKMYSSGDLAYYNRGRQLPNLFVANVNTSIDSVLFPTMSSQQDNIESIKKITRRSIKVSTYIIAPLMMGLAFTGNSLIQILLTDKWIPCVPYMQVFCVTYMFYPIHTTNLNAIKALGRSDLFLKLEILKKVLGVFILVIAMNYGVMAICLSLLVAEIPSQIINAWPNNKLMNYNYLEQIKDIFPEIFLAVSMGGIINVFNYFELHSILTLLIQILVGVIFYISCSKLFKMNSYYYIKNLIVLMFKRGESK